MALDAIATGYAEDSPVVLFLHLANETDRPIIFDHAELSFYGWRAPGVPDNVPPPRHSIGIPSWDFEARPIELRPHSTRMIAGTLSRRIPSDWVTIALDVVLPDDDDAELDQTHFGPPIRDFKYVQATPPALQADRP